MTSIAEWNEQLQQCRLDLERKRKLESRLQTWNEEFERQKRNAEAARQTLQAEEEDVERLAGSSFSHFWLGLFGKLDDRLRTEEREAAEAKLKYDAAQASLRAMEEERAEIIALLAGVPDAESQLARLTEQKEAWIRGHDADAADELERLSERIAAAKARLKETEEARRAGSNARDSLGRAEEQLGSAKNWGTYDMLGGGMIATMIKHGKIDDARDHIHEAQYQLSRFAEELKDLDWHIEGDAPQIGSFLTFSDYFFDGLISDWMVQGRINSSLESVGIQIEKVDRVLRRLDQERRRLEREAADCRAQYEQLVERYGRSS